MTDMTRRVAGLALMHETSPLVALDTITVLDRPHEPVCDRRARQRRTGTLVVDTSRRGDGTTPLPGPVETYLQSRYAHPVPEVAVRLPLTRRRTRFGRALGWCWRKRADAAALVLVALALVGAVAVMNAVLPGEWK